MRRSLLSALIGVCLVLPLLFSGCKSAKVSTPGYQYTSPDVTLALAPVTMARQVIDSALEWTDVTMPVKFTLRSPKSVSLSGRATMIRGREIKISFRMLGFEVGGLYADTDSIYFYEKLNRTMVVESMDRLRKESGLELENIQDVLLGRVTYPGRIESADDLLEKFEINDTRSEVMLVPRSSALPWHYLITAIDDDAVLRSLTVDLPPRGQIVCSYLPHMLTPVGPVSPEDVITASLDKQKLDASIVWSLESATWNKGVSPSMSLPKGYTRIPLARLLKSLAPPQ